VMLYAADGSASNPFCGYSGKIINENGDFRSSYAEPNYESWLSSRALVFNRTGKLSHDIADYSKLEDPGDGSLLTYAIPDEMGRAVDPITGSVVAAPLKIKNVKFAAGTGAALGSHDWAFEKVEGWPTLTGSAQVGVRTSWTFDAASVGDASFSLAGDLIFGEGARVVISGPRPSAERRRSVQTLGTAKSIVGTPVVSADGEWDVWVEGNALKAQYKGKGLIMLVK